MLTCVGSLGDLFPYLALGIELAARGHRPVIATTPAHRRQVEAAGLPFKTLRAATVDEPTPALMRRVFNGRRGIEFIVRELILPALRTAYEDTCVAAAGADLLVAHPLTLATRLVAETRNLPWISTQLAPSGMQSATDPSLFPGLGWLYRLHPPATVWRAVWRLADRTTRRWLRPYEDLRTELGLRDFGNPLFRAGHSPLLELGLFSPRFGVPQPDWPPAAVATGFPLFGQAPVPAPELDAWLAAGSPPIVFTLGSSAVFDPGSFFAESLAAARHLDRRALLLGASAETCPGALPMPSLTSSAPLRNDAEVFACRYLPYRQVFGRVAAVVHQGGIGTTSEALRSGRPMLVLPFGADQPDNAERLRRLGVARVLPRRAYRARRVAQELRKLLNIPAYTERAGSLGALISAERGAVEACDRMEVVLRGLEPPSRLAS